MNQDIKREWVKALRSGAYKQNHKRTTDSAMYCIAQYLRTSDSEFSAVGVLCDIIPIDSRLIRWFKNGSDSFYSYRISRWSLPFSDREKFDFDRNGSFQEALADMSIIGINFEDIADFIEESQI